MSGAKVRRYGWRISEGLLGETRQKEFSSPEARDADAWACNLPRTKYTVLRTKKGPCGQLWWAIRQLQEGRAVEDAEGIRWAPEELGRLLPQCGGVLPVWAEFWTLADPL